MGMNLRGGEGQLTPRQAGWIVVGVVVVCMVIVLGTKVAG